MVSVVHYDVQCKSGFWCKISWEALLYDCLHNAHQSLVSEKGKENPVICDINQTHLCICLWVVLCLFHWMAIFWTPLHHSHTHCVILLTLLTFKEHPILSNSLFSSSSATLHLPSLTISDLYLMSFPVFKVEENWLWVCIYRRNQSKLPHGELHLSHSVQFHK